MAALLRPSREHPVALPLLFCLLLLPSSQVTALSFLPNDCRLPLPGLRRFKDTLAFLGQGPPCGGPHAGRAAGRSSSLGSISSFFRRRKNASAAFNEEKQQQEEQRTRIDLYRLIGVSPQASASAVSARSKALQQQLRQPLHLKTYQNCA